MLQIILGTFAMIVVDVIATVHCYMELRESLNWQMYGYAIFYILVLPLLQFLTIFVIFVLLLSSSIH